MAEEPTWIQQVKERGQLSPGSKLLLPMHMDALVVGKGYKEVKWKNTALNLLNLKDSVASYGLGKYLDKPAAAKPEEDPIYQPGVHLHWVLPKVFRHGIQKEQDGAPDFPLVPNRWLVVRTFVTGNKTILKSWIVESDHITRGDAADPNWLLLNRTDKTDRLTPVTSSYEAVQTGRTLPFDKNWKETSNNPLFLTIMSPGDPGFAASYASCRGVFGFHDQMTGDGNPDGLYSYMVTGWYSDPAKDILYGVTDADTWLKRMKEYSLVIDLPEDNKNKIPLPDGVLCHATVFNVEWKGAKNQYTNKQLPDTKFVATSIGHSPLDALAPVILKNIPAIKNGALESFFAAFQYKMLADYDSASGREVLKKQVHTQSFNIVQAGSAWAMERKETSEAGRQKPGILPALPESLSVPLQELNELQEEYDEKINELHSLQSQLYAYWFKRTWTYTEDCQLPNTTPEDKRRLTELRKKLKDLYSREAPVKPAIPARIDKLKERLSALKRRRPLLQDTGNEDTDPIDKYDGLINEKYTALKDQLDKIKDPVWANLTVKETKLPPFYLAKDPSLVLSGVQPSAKYKDSGALTGRLADQLIDKIFYQRQTTPASINIAAAKLNEQAGAVFPVNGNIPAAIQSLFNEMQLLNPALAAAGAAWAYFLDGGLAPTPEKLQALANELAALVQNPDPAKFRNDANLTVVLPADFATASWLQPWTPLLMEWELEWYPSYTSLAHEEVMRKWVFGDKQGDVYNNIDFVFKQAKPDQAVVKKYSGRIPLTADLGKKISEVFANDLPFLGSSGLENLQPLSQELSGLNNNLVMRENSTQLPPLSYNQAENKFMVDPLVSDIDDQYTWNPMAEETGFFPFRGGHFKITALRVIDSFGQALDMLPGEFSVSQSMPVIRDTTSPFITLPLRLAQPARLRFKWMAAAKPGMETTADPASSPVCGWLLSNKLDKSLMVFDTEGNAAGALQSTATGSVIWTHAPGRSGNADINATSLNEYAKGVIKGILDTGAATVLNDLVRQIDELQKRVFAKTARQSITMALPVGYPVAIVKASCRLELKDLPVQYQGWDWETYDARISKVRFPVFIGDTRSKVDGLAGYFIQGNYKQLHLPYAYDRPPAHPYFTRNGNITVSAADNPGNLVLLMDPRMGVHISCGILPAGYYELPDQLINQAIEAIQPAFLVNPVLTFKTGVRMPLAALADKEWQWITASNAKPTGWNDPETLDKMMKGVLSFESLHIAEGWLKLINKPKKI